MEVIYLRVPDPLHARFAAQAQRTGTTHTALGIRILQEWLDQAEQAQADGGPKIGANTGRWSA